MLLVTVTSNALARSSLEADLRSDSLCIFPKLKYPLIATVFILYTSVTLINFKLCIWNFSLPRPRVYPFTIPGAFPWYRHLLVLATQFPRIAMRRRSTFLSPVLPFKRDTWFCGSRWRHCEMWTGLKQQQSASDDTTSAQTKKNFKLKNQEIVKSVYQFTILRKL